MTSDSTGPATPGPESPDVSEPPERFRFPSAFTVLAGVTVGVWLLTFVIPTGAYKLDSETGRAIPGTYHSVQTGLSFLARLKQLFLAPVNGLYGVQNAKGFIGPDETGQLFGAAGVFLFVIAIGIFITVSLSTGAIDNGVARVAHRLRDRGPVVIVILMLVFSLGGTAEGMAEETLGFYALVVPLMLSLGYDRMVALATIHVGAGVGVLASTVNPFATGVASDAAGVSIGDGLLFRFLMYVVLTTGAVLFVLRYARRVKADPSRSMVTVQGEDAELASRGLGVVPTITSRQRVVLVVVGLTFAMLIFAIVPWAQVIEGPSATSYPWQLDWYFPELAMLFVVMSLVVGLIGGLGEKRLTDTIVRGAGDFVGVGLVIVLARGVTVIMNNSQITATVLHSMESLVTHTSSGVFAALMFAVNLPLAFLVPSTSGHAALAMPVLAPLADFAGVSRSLVVTAFQSASGVVNLVTPTSAVVMGGLALAKVRYDEFLRFIAPLILGLLVLCTAFLVLGATFS